MKTPSNNPNEYDRTLSLREYRLLHPQSADYPTLTESTVVGFLLDRRRRRLDRAARRRELYRNLLALPRKVAVSMAVDIGPPAEEDCNPAGSCGHKARLREI